MVTIFLLVVSIYCIAGIMVHLYHSISTLQQKSEKHYVLHTEDEVDILEWYYRCFKRFSRTMGVDVSITVVASTVPTDSVSLINRWQRHEGIIRYVEAYDLQRDTDIHIHLNNKSDLQKLPF